MIFTTLMIASLLNVSDPSGDAVGAGELAAPKAAIFRNIENFDVLNLSIAEQNTFAFEISMASLENPWNLPLGFSLPIIEVYAAIDPLKTNSFLKDLLPGSDMSIGNGRWNYAFRITGDAIDVFTVEGRELKNIVEDVDLAYTITDNRIYIETNIRLGGDISVYAMSGSYDPFSESGWRGVTPNNSAWMLSSPTQSSPVMDVVVDDFAMQKRSIQAGVLPEITASARQPYWLWLVVAGLVTCLLALIARPRKAKTVNVGQPVGVGAGEILDDTIASQQSVLNQEASVGILDVVDNKDHSEQAEQHEKVLEEVYSEQVQDNTSDVQVSDSEVTKALKVAVQPNEVKAITGEITDLKETQQNRPIQWTSWDEGDLASEDTIIEFDRIANEESEARASQARQLNIEVLDSQTDSKATTEETAQNSQKSGKTLNFQENLLPDTDDESLLSSKEPPKGFTKRMKTFGLAQVASEEVNEALDDLDDSAADGEDESKS